MPRTVVLFVLVLLAAAGAAQVAEASTAPVPDPVLMAALEAEIFGGVGANSYCSAVADCSPYSPVACSTSISGATCEAVDRNCSAGQRGFVRCGSNVTYCPACCNEGSNRDTPTGYCCANGRLEWAREWCVGGEWVFSGYICGGPCGPPNP